MIVGLTGTIASGKSSVLQYFRDLGWEGISTDHLAREALQRPDVQHAIVQRWGSGVADADGILKRGAVAAIVFSDRSELEWLEELLHPIVREAWLAAVAAKPQARFVVEIPLLHEKRLEKYFSPVVCLSSSESQRLARYEAKGGNRKDFAARQAFQFSALEKESASDIVLTNHHSKQILFSQVNVLSRRLSGI